MIDIQIIKDAFDIYSRHYSSLGDYSATTIIDSPRRVALFKRYGEGVEYTPESQAASLVGTAVHDKMEELLKMANVKHPSYLVERSVAHPVTVSRPDVTTEAGILLPRRKVWTRLLAGKFDILAEKKDLIDVKTCKTWKLIFDPDKVDWTKQLNIYCWLLLQRSIQVKTLTVVAFFMDWIASQALRSKTYPKEPIMEFKIPMWDSHEQERFITSRLLMHCEAEDTKDNDLPRCTMEEMWQNPEEYAIFKDQKAKRALKVCKDSNLHDAITTAQTLKGVSKNSYIEIRHEKRKRCELFCAVNDKCNQYKSWIGQQDAKGKNTDKFELGGVM